MENNQTNTYMEETNSELVHTYNRFPVVLDHGEGVYLYDVDGNRYVDVISSWWCNLLGHCNPHISAEIKKQADTLEHVIFANFTHKQAIRLCERLSKILPKGLCKFNFTDKRCLMISGL